jgi:mono/diheme cytochrome c family protein
MRGTIEVAGDVTETATIAPPLYVTLNLDLDAPHPSEVVPDEKPSATRGAALGVKVDRVFDGTQSPAQVWAQLRSSSITQGLSDDQVWDLVAWQRRSKITPERLTEGQRLYAQNCAACHGEAGQGDGVSVPSLLKTSTMPGMAVLGYETVAPIDFMDAKNMLGASDAILEGKIVRGGMGTGMPYWGSIFTSEQIQALVDFLWTFQFDE